MSLQIDPVLALNQEAKARAEQGVDIVNATTGMFWGDDGKLPIAPIFAEANYLDQNNFQYSSIAGDAKYLNGIRGWFFEKEGELLTDFPTISTPGGTGAVSLAFREVGSAGFEAIVGKISWPNYFIIMDVFGVKSKIVDNFVDDHFNFEAIRSAFLASKKPCLVINDPCHNPTGYSMSDEQWRGVVELLNSRPEESALILDLAYFDFAKKESRKRIVDALISIDSRIPVYICFSFSKTLSAYGLRLGALAFLHLGEEGLTRIKRLARATWSNCNAMGMHVVGEALSQPEKVKILKSWIGENREKNEGRASIFLKEARENGLKILPYQEGFFCTIVVSDSYKTVEKLKAQDIFVVPLTNHLVRFAFSGVPTRKIPGLAKIIKDAA